MNTAATFRHAVLLAFFALALPATAQTNKGVTTIAAATSESGVNYANTATGVGPLLTINTGVDYTGTNINLTSPSSAANGKWLIRLWGGANASLRGGRLSATHATNSGASGALIFLYTTNAEKSTVFDASGLVLESVAPNTRGLTVSAGGNVQATLANSVARSSGATSSPVVIEGGGDVAIISSTLASTGRLSPGVHIMTNPVAANLTLENTAINTTGKDAAGINIHASAVTRDTVNIATVSLKNTTISAAQACGIDINPDLPILNRPPVDKVSVHSAWEGVYNIELDHATVSGAQGAFRATSIYANGGASLKELPTTVNLTLQNSSTLAGPVALAGAAKLNISLDSSSVIATGIVLGDTSSLSIVSADGSPARLAAPLVLGGRSRWDIAAPVVLGDKLALVGRPALAFASAQNNALVLEAGITGDAGAIVTVGEIAPTAAGSREIHLIVDKTGAFAVNRAFELGGAQPSHAGITYALEARANGLWLVSSTSVPAATTAADDRYAATLAAVGGRGATATITGRILNVATGYYLKNAEVRLDGTDNIVFTDDSGYYAIAVPPGNVSLTASYASVRSATSAITVADGAAARLDFDLQPITLGTSAATAKGEDIVMLDAFSVTADRDGQAKAIQDQRAAPNAITAIATDNFGDLSLGALGDFLRFMPGITLDGVSEPEGVRVGGLDAKYTSFTRDGMNLATSTSSMDISMTGGGASGGNNARSFNLLPMSVVGVESIEFHHTLTARMDAGGAAGTVNIVSKNLFNRKKDEFRFQIGLNGSSDHIDLSRTYMPDDRRYLTTLPGGQFSYAGVFAQQRLGIDLSASYNDSYVFTQYMQSTYAYKNPQPGLHPEGTDFDADPAITGLQFHTTHSFRTRGAVNLTTDYKLSNRLVLGLRTNYSFYENEYFAINQYLWARMASGMFRLGPSEGYDLNQSSLTRIVAHANNGINSRVEQTRNNRLHRNANYLFSPRLSYKHGPLAIDFRLGYSRAETSNRSAEKGYFYQNGMMISRIGWTATRDSSTSPEWTIAQIRGEGEDWSNAENWQRTDGYTEPHRMIETDNTVELISGYLDVTYARAVFGHPVTFKFGGGARNNDFTYNATYAYYTYVGDTYDQRQATLPWNENYAFNFKLGGKGGNIDSLSWPVLNSRELYSIFLDNPEQFNPDTVDDFRRNLLASRDLTERIEAAYVELNTRIGRFGINAGIRDERTITDVKILQMRSNDEVTEAGYSTSSIDGVLYQYHNGERANRHRSYNNIFLSGGIKYDFTKNLRFQLSASQSLLRPDYGNIAGVVAYPESAYTTQMWIPNPLLKPESTTKTFARLEWYLRPAGLLSVSAFRLDIKNKQIRNVEIDYVQATLQAGFDLDEYTYIRDTSGGQSGPDGTPLPPEEGGDPERPGYIAVPMRYRSTINAEGSRNILGLTIEYRQQLTFLPGLLRGTSVFGSVTFNSLQNARDDYERIWNVEKSANGGIGYRFGRFNIQFRASWTDDVLDAVNVPSTGRYYYENANVYRQGRIIVDITGALRLNKHLEIGFGVRNPFNTPYCLYSEKDHRLRAYRYDGAVWSLNLRGTF